MFVYNFWGFKILSLFGRQKRVVQFSVCIISLLLLVYSSHAHHGTVVSRPSTPAKSMNNQFNLDSSKALRFQSFLEFSQWRSESPRRSIYQDLDLGDLQMYLLDLKLSYHFHKNWNTSFAIPINYFNQNRQEQKAQIWGLGDIRFTVNHLLSSSSQSGASKVNTPNLSSLTTGYRWSLFFGSMIPTGDYERETLLSDSQLIANDNGGLELSSFSAQTSLGADVWQVMIGTSFNWQLTPFWSNYINLSSNLPVGKTSDGIHWGADISLSNLNRYQISPKLAFFWGALLAIHLPDQIVQSESNKQSTIEVGGHKQLFFPFGIAINTQAKFTCRLQAEVPIWQQIKVPQLLKTYALSVSC